MSKLTQISPPPESLSLLVIASFSRWLGNYSLVGSEANYYTDSALVEETEIVMYSLYNWLALVIDHVYPPPWHAD